MIGRRRMLSGAVMAGVAGLTPLTLRAARPDAPDWQRWKARFLRPEGRVVDALQGEASHSEGQAYGLLLAQAQGDHEAFERIEAWTRDHLLVRGNSLMGWRWQPQAQPAVPDARTATDGDLIRGWALLRAARDSGRGWHREAAVRIARDLSIHALTGDPRAPAEPLLMPRAAPEGLAPPEEGVLVNPSYYLSRALRELGEAAGLPVLIRAADHGESLLAELAGQGRLPDWTRVTVTGAGPAPGYHWHLGYDALRIPLYLLWSGRGGHPAVARARALFAQVAGDLPAGHVPVRLDEAGRLSETSDYAGYRALWMPLLDGPQRAALGPLRDGAGGDGQLYYPATLDLLATVAARETG